MSHFAAPTTDIDPPPSRARFGIRQMMFAIFCAGVGMFVLLNHWRILIFLLFSFVPVGIVTGVIVVLVRRRASEQFALLKVMALASEKRMPLSQGIAAFADLCTGSTRRQSRAMAYLLESGVPLPQALASVPGLLPPSAVVLACVGWNEGALAASLAEAVDASETRRLTHAGFLPKLGYLAATVVFLQNVVAFYLYYIAPKFELIFMDFGINLPEVTRTLFHIGQLATNNFFFLLLIPLELAILLYVPFSYFGWIRWELPLLDFWFRRRETAAVLRSLSIGAEAGRPLSSTIDLLSRFYPRNWVRASLLRTHAAIETGTAWPEALRKQGIVSRGEAAVLDSARRAGNLPWALRMVGDGQERRMGYRLQAFAQASFPVIVVMMGLIVGFIAVAFFYPLVTLIEKLSG